MAETAKIDPTGLNCPVPIVDVTKPPRQLSTSEDTTAREQAEDTLPVRDEELDRERANLQAIVDAAQIGMLLLDERELVTLVNDASTKLLGRDAPELLNRQLGDGLCCVHAREKRNGRSYAAACVDCPLRNAVARALESGRAVRNVEATMRLEFGGEKKQVDFAVNATPLTLRGRKHALLTVTDITAYRQTEANLRRSETKYRTLYDSTSDAIMLLDDKGFFDCNDATVQVFGCSDKAEFCTKHPADLSPAYQPCGTDSMTLAKQRIATAMEEGSHRFEWMHKRLDTGEDFPAEVLLNALDLDGRPVLQAVVRDVSERTQAEEALKSSERKLRTITDAALDAVIMMDPSGTVAHWNPAAETIFGYSREEMLGQAFHSILAPSRYREAASKGLSNFQKSGHGTAIGKTLELTALRRDGAEFPIEISINAIQQQGGWCAVALVRDISERKKTEAERNQLQEKLLEASRLAGMAEVATGVLHNVGNVLNSVNVTAQLMADRVKQSGISSLAKANELIKQHADDLGEFITRDERGKHFPAYLKELTHHLLHERDSQLEDLSTLMKNVEHIKKIVCMQQAHATCSGATMPVSLTDLVDEAVTTHDASFLKHSTTMVREYEELPQVTTDKHKVLQILVNLINNATQAVIASDSREQRITLRVRRSDEDSAIVAVEDNGVGIPIENQTRVFQHGFTTKKNGHGFGLHSSALAAKELGGSLTVHSDGPGCGATFTLTLPLESRSQ